MGPGQARDTDAALGWRADSSTGFGGFPHTQVSWARHRDFLHCLSFSVAWRVLCFVLSSSVSHLSSVPCPVLPLRLVVGVCDPSILSLLSLAVSQPLPVSPLWPPTLYHRSLGPAVNSGA